MIIIKGLYVHIPFCKQICSYCDFCKRVPKNEEMIWQYLKALKSEYQANKEKYNTIYIGGGTPSSLSLEAFSYLLSIFKDQKPLEYTIEINPESYSKEKGILMKSFGVNRVSIGVQTFNEKHLKILNRQHKNDDVFKTIDSLNSLGINNISLDLMFALPGQSLADISHDLAIIKDLKITHVSYYSLILEEKTLFYHLYKKGLIKLIDHDMQAKMFEKIIKTLNSNGFKQYEVSNFALNKKDESIHNKLYWSLKPYQGLGAGSHGFDGRYRYFHKCNVGEYIKKQMPEKTYQTDQALYQDYLIFGLRLNKGISLSECLKRFNRNPLNDFPILYSFIEEKLLEINNGYLFATLKGMMLLNQIVEVFI